MSEKANYGTELIVDLHGCDAKILTNIHSIGKFLDELCELIGMEKVERYWWQDLENEEDHLAGISVVQFIKTSSITLHVLTRMERVYMNLFSCKDFDTTATVNLIKSWSRGTVKTSIVLARV